MAAFVEDFTFANGATREINLAVPLPILERWTRFDSSVGERWTMPANRSADLTPAGGYSFYGWDQMQSCYCFHWARDGLHS